MDKKLAQFVKDATNAPAPWHFDHNRDEITVYADNDWPVARLLEHNDFHNGWLISAAPTMLAALQKIRDVTGTSTEAWHIANAAIAKASPYRRKT